MDQPKDEAQPLERALMLLWPPLVSTPGLSATPGPSTASDGAELEPSFRKAVFDADANTLEARIEQLCDPSTTGEVLGALARATASDELGARSPEQLLEHLARAAPEDVALRGVLSMTLELGRILRALGEERLDELREHGSEAAAIALDARQLPLLREHVDASIRAGLAMMALLSALAGDEPAAHAASLSALAPSWREWASASVELALAAASWLRPGLAVELGLQNYVDQSLFLAVAEWIAEDPDSPGAAVVGCYADEVASEHAEAGSSPLRSTPQRRSSAR